MVKIPLPKSFAEEFSYINSVIEESENAKQPRRYLGMSSIGFPCERETWATFRWVTKPNSPSWLIDAANSGHMAERIMIERIKLVPWINLVTFSADNTNAQIEFSDFNGHFKGHPDGIIQGVKIAPKDESIWEHKDKSPSLPTSKDKFKSLINIIDKYGEKSALKKWDHNYYVQGQLYMHYSGLKKHFLTCSSGISRQWVAVRTDYNKDVALKYVDKAERTIKRRRPPERQYSGSGWPCIICNHKEWCHNGKEEWKNCFSCKHSLPIENEKWFCEKGFSIDNPESMQCGDGWERHDEI